MDGCGRRNDAELVVCEVRCEEFVIGHEGWQRACQAVPLHGQASKVEVPIRDNAVGKSAALFPLGNA